MTVLTPRRDLPFRWLGGSPCLDFANTIAWLSDTDGGLSVRPRPERERFTDYPRLVAWARAAGILSDREAASVLETAQKHPDSAAAALQTAMSLRDAIHRLCIAAANGAEEDSTSVSALNAVLARGLARRRVCATDDGFTWTWEAEAQPLELPLWPVALSAAELLVSDDLSRVRQCSGNDCGFLFLDKGRGPGRRWCDMAHCGNRAKARRHYHRTGGRDRAAAIAPGPTYSGGRGGEDGERG